MTVSIYLFFCKKRPKIDNKDIPKYEVRTRVWCSTDASGNVKIDNDIIYYTNLKEK